MKKVVSILAVFMFSLALFAQDADSQWDDGFSIDLDLDLSEAISEESSGQGGNGKMANVLQGLWIEASGHTNAIIRDIASGEKKGYEVDNNHFVSNANWWFWGDITKDFHLDAEIGLWNFDNTMYQADSFGANIPLVTWGDGFQSLAAMLFSPIYNMNDNSIGALNKLGFTIQTPYVNVKFGYGNLKENGMASFTGIYNVLDQWLDVGKGFTEISNGRKLSKIGNVKINALAAFSQMRGTYGMYDFLDLKFGENYRAALTFGSKTSAEELFYYNTDNINAASLYFMANPLDALKIESHALASFGTDVDEGLDSLAAALRFSYTNEKINFVMKESYAGSQVHSVWGSDGQLYDDINADTLTSKVDFSWQIKDFINIGLDETFTINNSKALSEGLMNLRSQPLLDFDLSPLAGINLTFGMYGVINLDRLALSTSANREIIPSFTEGGIEIKGKDIARNFKNFTFDYALSFEYKDWTSGNSYERSVTYNSFMFTADITDTLNIHAGALIRSKKEEDASFVPFGFALGLKRNAISFIPGNPDFWIHFAYAMNPYSENNYSLYRADNWMNKAPHRTYLLNDLYEDYTTSQISLGLIWNLQ